MTPVASPLPRARVESAEVRYATEPIVLLDAADVGSLKRDAAENTRRRIRLCAHHGVDDPVHEMLIVHSLGTYVRPHQHIGKTESFHVVEGDVDVVLFDDQGGVAVVIRMGAFASGRPFYYRIAVPLFHTLLIRSEILVFHETTSGPFRRADTVFAPWAPEDGDSAAVRQYLADLDARLNSRARTV
jgi:cupin fold WbuC family metalloprotein